MNRIRREILAEVKTMKKAAYETKIFQHEDAALPIYEGKPSNNVLVHSTMHPSVTVRQSTKKLPETVEYYNSIKYRVDVLDQKARMYTTKIPSRRRPLQVFSNILDFMAINSVILYNQVSKTKYN